MSDKPSAVAMLTPAVAADANWFVDPGQRHFIDLGTAQQMAALLLKTFAVAAATGAGSELGKMLVAGLKGLVAGKPASAPAAPAPGAASDPAQAERILAEALGEFMPRPRAEALARKTRDAAQ